MLKLKNDGIDNESKDWDEISDDEDDKEEEDPLKDLEAISEIDEADEFEDLDDINRKIWQMVISGCPKSNSIKPLVLFPRVIFCLQRRLISSILFFQRNLFKLLRIKQTDTLQKCNYEYVIY